jgi:hypothetical protein
MLAGLQHAKLASTTADFRSEAPPAAVVTMSFNPLAPVTDYQTMLNRIFWFTTAAALAAVWWLRQYVPGLNSQLGAIDFVLQYGDDKVLPIPAGYLFPALAVGLVTRVFRLHARTSDCLGIRERFDIDVIMREFAERLGYDSSLFSEDRLIEGRTQFMRTAFYAFVSGPQPQIDPQLVHQALDAWSWFWIGVEATLLFVLTGLGLVMASEYRVGVETIGAALVLSAIGLPLMRAQCQRYAVAQVRAILRDSVRESAVREAFDDLTGAPLRIRRAA